MADLSITAANVVKGTSSQVVHGIAGATITAGQSIYADATDGGDLKLADASAVATAAAVGVALHAASDKQPLAYIASGDFDPGATVAVGVVYAVSATAGGIALVADIGSGEFKTTLGVGTSTSNIRVQVQVSGVAEA